jgi:hypothetical protein
MAVRQAARRPPPALRHVIVHRVAFAAVALTAMITAVFTAATVSFFSAVTTVAARTELTRNPGSAIMVTATVSGDRVRQASAQVAGLIRGPRPSLIRSIVHARGLTAIVTTHDRALMDIADRVLQMRNGQL